MHTLLSIVNGVNYNLETMLKLYILYYCFVMSKPCNVATILFLKLTFRNGKILHPLKEGTADN